MSGKAMASLLAEFSESGDGDDAKIESRLVVRLVHSYWHDSRGAYLRISLNYLKRKSRGFNFLQEDCSMIDAGLVLSRIVNLHACKEGVYELRFINESTDWETGYLDDWDYQLVPYVESET